MFKGYLLTKCRPFIWKYWST